MKKLLFLLHILFTLLIFGCDTEMIVPCSELGCLVFQGTISDLGDNTPIEGAYIEVLYDDSDFTFYDPTYTVGESETDETGFFTISFSGQPYKVNNGYFIVKISKDGFNPIEHYFSEIDSTDFDIATIVNSQIGAQSTLDVKIKTGEYIRDFECFLVKDYPYLNVCQFEENASLVDTTFTYNVTGNRFASISYKYRKFGETYEALDSVFIAGGTKEEFLIEI